MTMQRRSFLTLLGASAAAWPTTGSAQQDGRVRRIAVLQGGLETAVVRSNLAMLRQELAKLGWVEGRNLRIDFRSGAGEPGRINESAAELVSLAPDVIVSASGAATKAVQEQTRTIPIVFVGVGDPVVGGLVDSIARPTGNTTGITNWYSSLGGKWLELLKEVAPRVTRVAILYNPETYLGSLEIIERAASQLALPTIRMPVHSAFEVVRAVDRLAVEPNGGLLVLPGASISTLQNTIISVATQHQLPTISTSRAYVVAGGLIAYGTDGVELFRPAAAYVDRILRGAKINELPVQFPTKYDLFINLRTAKAIGLSIPESFLVRADEVIE
jgi:putative ABC transport system substrate-binding protein